MAKKVRKILSYFTIFDPAEEGGYNVSFPDFPGCVTFGRTFEEAKEKAKEVLELWLEELASPPTRSVKKIIESFKAARLYNKEFLGSLKEGLKRSSCFNDHYQ